MYFSVIIPTYKTSIEMLLRAVESVRVQNETSFEIIVVDDNPKDSSWKRQNVEYSEENNDNIKWIFHEDNKGANAARNTGIRAASGKIVAFLDSDDEWSIDYLREVRTAYEQSEAVITASEIVRIFPNRISRTVKTHPDGYIFDDLVYSDIVGPTSAVTVNRNVVIEAGLFDESLPARQDYDMWLRVCKLGQIKYIRKPLVKLYCDDHSRISSGVTNHERGTLAVIDKLANDSELADKREDIIFAHTKYLGDKCLREEEYEKARKYYKDAMGIRKSGRVKVLYYASYFPFALMAGRKVARAIINKTGVKE